MFKKLVLIILCIACMGTITGLSTQNSEDSTKLSESVTEKIVSHSKEYKKSDEKRKKEIVKKENNKMRNIAHFSMFMLLGIFVFSTFNEFSSAKVMLLYAFLICAAYALFDEIYQKLLNNGRAFEWSDIMKDCCGAATGIALVFLKNIVLKCRKKHNVAADVPRS